MSLYARILPLVTVSTASDYSNPDVDMRTDAAYETTFDEYIKYTVEATTTAATVDLSLFSTISFLRLKNKSTTASLYATLTSLLASKTFGASELSFANGNPDTLTRSDSGGSWVTDGVIKGAFVRVSGGSNSQAGRYLCWDGTGSTNTVLTLATNEALPGSFGADAGTPTVQVELDNIFYVPPGGVVDISANIRPASGLILRGTATLDVGVFVGGT